MFYSISLSLMVLPVSSLPFPSLPQMALIRVVFALWTLGRDALKAVSMVARELLTRLVALPGLVLPKAAVAVINFVSRAYAFDREV